MRAAKKAGHRGRAFSAEGHGRRRSTFGRGRRAALCLASRSPSRRSLIPIVRHRGGPFRSVPLSKHVAYLKRDGVTRDGADAQMFDATSDDADTKAFAERYEEDRHHFRFTVSPEDAGQMADLRAFTRELMARRGARPRDAARLGRGGSLEHRQPTYPRARPRPRRGWPRPGHQPRLHLAMIFAAARRNGSRWNWSRAVSRRSASRWRRRSMPSVGPGSIDRSAPSLTKTAGSPISAPTPPARIPSFAV